MAKIALYLAGGGSRGSYQAGVLKAIAEILAVKKMPFELISGVSVGSINAAILAENAHDFPLAVAKLENLWSGIHCQQIFNASNFALSKSVFRNIGNLVIKQRQSGFLLDTKPLHEFVRSNIDFTAIRENIANKNLATMEVITHCYEAQQTISFYDHYAADFEDWYYPRHVSQRAELNDHHILASSALPLFFPPAKISGFHYGDGSMGLVSPLRGAIRFQVEKVLILGTRPLPSFQHEDYGHNGEVGFARVLGSMLNNLFLDNLDRDIEMVNRMNEIARLLSLWKKRHSPWRPIQTMHLRPSVDLGEVAQAQYASMPALLRLLLNLLGAKSHSGDLLSFLLFEGSFTREAIRLGYEDTMATRQLVEDFFA